MPGKKKRVSIHHLKKGMLLADDAVTPGGQLLIASGTTITENHLFRMNLYQIMSAVINIDDVDVSSDPLMDDDVEASFLPTGEPPASAIHLLKTEAFLRFNAVYSRVDAVIRAQFEAILRGESIDRARLLSATDALIKSVRFKGDLLTYMHHVRSEDYPTYVHAINVSVLCRIFGQWLKMSAADIEELTITGLIHDIGKTKVPAHLLVKETPLTSEEFSQLKAHAQLGYDMVRHLDISDRMKKAVLLHHERNDGSGYPFGLTEPQIPDFAKIIAILDIYDAMTTHRTYHMKFSPFKVIQIFEQESYGHLDTKYLFTFLENIAHYYLGKEVRLTDGTVGKIIFIHNQSPSRPIIQSGDTIVDLLTTYDLGIKEIL